MNIAKTLRISILKTLSFKTLALKTLALKTSALKLALGTGLGLALFSGTASAAGLMQPVNSNLPQLSIREHHVNVVIEDSYAVTRIEQVFHNPHNQALEAFYSFPVPEGAAVGEFTYWIDGQPVTGEVIEKRQARAIYQQEQQAGNAAALIEQDSYKTFDISVTPVQPNADVRIKLVYIQPAHVDTGIGRYVYPLEDGGVDEQRNTFWTRNETVEEKFSFNMTLRSSYPIDSVRLPQHAAARVRQTATDEWHVSLTNQAAVNALLTTDDSPVAEHQPDSSTISASLPVTNQTTATQLDKDILLYWRHAEGLPGSLDMITYRERADRPGTFMLTLTPGDDLAAISGGRDWVFVLDVSGSMQGKYSTLIDGVRQGLAKLSPADRFKIILFNNRSEDFSRGFQPVSPQTIAPLLQRLEQYQPNSGTNLYAGLERGLQGLDTDRSTAIILVTDGVANVGVTEKRRFLKLMKEADTRLFTFVMGNSANRPLLEGMAEVSNGFAISISNADDIVGQLMLATSKVSHQALRDVTLTVDGARITDLTPADIGSLYRGEQLTVLGHYRQAGPARVTLSARVGDEQRQYSTEINLPEQSSRHPELERLWAFARIENLQTELDYLGEDSDIQQAITDLAVQYDLVTDYTSMIVVPDARFQQLGIKRDNARRIATEHTAREQRAAQGVQNNRVDTQQPMANPSTPRAALSSSRASGSGSGAVGHWVLLLIGSLLLVQFANNRAHNYRTSSCHKSSCRTSSCRKGNCRENNCRKNNQGSTQNAHHICQQRGD